jgi:GntR family transcriptional regulator / MocR family aminotransferase
MPVEWSGSGPEVLITLDRGGRVPLRAQLEDQLRHAIRSGRLTSGEHVPSSRALATMLRLSRGLVQDAYAQLQAEGYLVTRGGAATRVAQTAASAVQVRQNRPSTAPALTADFASGVPDLGSVPREDWAWAIREACRSAPNIAFDYNDPQGSSRLCEVLAAYLRRVRAVDADADQVVVCTGMRQGLALVLRALAAQGVHRIAFEDPGAVESTPALAAWAGMDAVPVPVDELGIDVAALEATGARAVLVTPAHQWPTGVVLAPQRRRELVAWAARNSATIIEDDYDAEFRYDRDPVGSMQGLAPDLVITMGTVSKSIAPVVRLGWVVGTPDLALELAGAKDLADRGSPGLDQLALAALIEAGRFDRHLRKMRSEYSARRDVLAQALAEQAPGVRLTGLAAGFHAIAHLPAGTSEQAVIRAARARSVGLYGMSTYRADHSPEPAQLVFGFGNTSQRAIRAGVTVLGDILRTLP